ncbi:MAG TPA: hypothetical protein VFU41_08300 [Gemmatimonadales bacterium]|nr:hypothetical protein [Gemmatimonadales bacterium]
MKAMTFLLVLSALLAACSDPLAPFQPEVANVPDNFQFQATALTNVTATKQYIWQNSGTTANVNQSSAVSGGAATLTIRDANGTQVYAQDVSANGTFVTSAGVSGAWTIQVVLTNVDGTVNFRAQKP